MFKLRRTTTGEHMHTQLRMHVSYTDSLKGYCPHSITATLLKGHFKNVTLMPLNVIK